MAATVTRYVSTLAFHGHAGTRANRHHMELWNVVLAGGTTAFTITTFKITKPVAYMVFDDADASVVAITATVTPLGSGTATLAFTGGTSGKTYLVIIQGGV